MRSILTWLGLTPDSATDPPTSMQSRSVQQIMIELETLEPEQARYVAAFGYILTRVANADFHIADDESSKMREIVEQIGGLAPEQAKIVVELAQAQNEAFGATDDFLVTRQFRDISSHADRIHLLDCLFAVAAVDHSITSAEEEEIAKIAKQLLLSHDEYIAARRQYSDKREVMKRLRETTG